MSNNYIKDYTLTIGVMKKSLIMVAIAISLVFIIDTYKIMYRNKKIVYYEKTLEILKEILENRNKVVV